MALGFAAAYVLCAFSFTVIATPDVAFPFNSQVPTVARVNHPFLFQFSASTFAPDTTDFTYSLSSQPSWLDLDSASRTLSGTPHQTDVGSSSFTLTAADETGASHMSCTLVVSSDPAPQIEGDISKQLAESANLSSSQPPVVTLLPSTSFRFDFQRGSFIDIVQRKLYYYATLTDHTPLPAWLQFDSQSLVFSGEAPDLSAFPQSWNINLIASDVAGFAGTTASFAIAIGTEQLVFVPSEQNINITGGTQFSFQSLKKQLFRNGQALSAKDLVKAGTTSLPNWLAFDNETLGITGEIPKSVNDQSFSVTVTDELGSNATATINLMSGNASLISGAIGTITAYVGQTLDYRFPDSLFPDPTAELSVTLPTSAAWLDFDADTKQLQGTVPSQASPTAITATLTAKSTRLGTTQTEDFTISIKASSSSTTLSTSRLATHASPTNSSTASPTSAAIAASPPQRRHLSGGIIAAIVVLSVIAAALLIICLFLCCRRRKRNGYERHLTSPTKNKIISRPIPAPPETAFVNAPSETQQDVEKADDTEAPHRVYDPPPQIALTLPPRRSSKRKSNWLKRFSRASQASSIGNGEDAIKLDMNIPEWGIESPALHTPHDSFSVPAEMARGSRQPSQTSPTKLASQRLKERHLSRQSFGLGNDTAGGLGIPRNSSRASRRLSRRASSAALSTVMDRSSQVSLSTRGTSVLSTRPSEFPAPPTRASRTMPLLRLSESEKHRSIRLVARSDSITDSRSIEDKRKSFIRNRASTSLQSPLFAHGSRVSSCKNGLGSAAASSSGSVRHPRRGRNVLPSYSESSSLEPQGRESRRLSARVRSTFAPSFPRAITCSTMGADDEGEEPTDSSSGFRTVGSSFSGDEWQSQLTLPKHERSWVLPGEASPTPPPVPPTSRQPSTGAAQTPSGDFVGPRQKWKDRLKHRSSSPLSTAVAVPVANRTSYLAQSEDSRKRRSRLSEPMGLVSNDSLTRARLERPRLVHNNSKRPVSVEEVKRLSSMKAETGGETDTQGGSEVWEDTDDVGGAGLMPKPLAGSKVSTVRSDMSGPAFL